MKVLTSPCRLTIAALVVVAIFVASNGGIDRVAADSPIKIVSVAFSDPNSDHLWQSSRDLDITVTLNQATTVDSGSLVGTSSQELGDGFQCQLQDGKVADYAFYRSGNGTNQLVFRCRLVGPPRTRVFIQENSMHLVNPRPGTYLNFHPRFIRTSDTHDLSGPTVTSINTNQAPSDGLWAGGDRVDVNVTFSENVNVTTRNNNPYIIVIEKTTNGSQAHQYRYRTGSGTRTITFSRTLPSDIIPRHSIFLVADRFRHGNGYIVASANKALADLSHDGGTIGGVFTRGVSSKAAFLPGPKRHDGSSFAKDIVFNGEQNVTPQNDASKVVKVTNGVLGKAEYINDDDRTAWKITITPEGTDDVKITLPSGSCSDQDIVCVDGEPLETDLSTTVQGPLTASFTSVPSAHNGSAAFDVHLDFDRAPASSFSYVTVENGLFTITGGSIDRVWRRQGGNDQLWGIQVRPNSTSDVTMSLRPTTDCLAEHAVCDSDGRMLAAGSTLTIQGPPTTNTAAQGLPTITGTAQVGETLTASTAGITDADGLTNVAYTYQWLADDAEITDATASTYMLVDDDEGRAIKVKVSFTDDNGNAEELTSAATAAVAAAVPGIPGNLTVSVNDTGKLDLSWDAPDSNGGSAITSYNVQWKETADSWDTAADVSDATATGTTYTASGLTDGTEYAFRVTAVNSVGDSDASGEATGTPRETTAPTVSSAAVDGSTLTITFSEALETGQTPDKSAFAVSVAGNSRGVHAVSISGSAVTLTLATAVSSGEAVTAGYTVPTGESEARLQDLVGNEAASFSGQAVANNTSAPTQEEGQEQPPTPLTASASAVPGSHDGSSNFTFELRLSEEPKDGFSYTTMKNHAFTVTGGRVTKANRLDPPSNIGWLVHITPDGNGAVTIVLPVTTDCTAQGAICTQDGRMLSTEVEVTVSGPGG